MEKENKVGKEEVGQKRTQLEKIRTKLYKWGQSRKKKDKNVVN
jgi:hypothetical protein